MRVAVIGAGPVGLYAAFRLVKCGHEVVVLERGERVAGNVRSWSFVTLFSKLELNLPKDARETLVEAGHEVPDEEAYLTGGEFVEHILEPLSAWLTASGSCTVLTGHEVVSIGRGRLLKSDAIMATGDKRRVGTRFRLLCRKVAGSEEEIVENFDVAVDASGTYGARTGNRVGIGGIPAPGEGAAEAAGLLRRVIPDLHQGVDKQLVAGKRVGVIGTGYSAITCLRGLSELALKGGDSAPAEVIWLTRRAPEDRPYQVLEDDPLPQRSALAGFGNALAKASAGDSQGSFGQTKFRYIPGMACASIKRATPDSLQLTLEVCEEGELTVDADVLFSLTGYHPAKELWEEIQVHTCYASDGPMKLAASLLAAKLAASGGGDDAGDCLKQAAPGAETLENPEPNFFVIGMKSYGRNPSFLMRVGYEQADLLADKLALHQE